MPGGAEVIARQDGFDFSSYTITTSVLGPLRVPLRFTDSLRLTSLDTMLDKIEMRFLGVLVGRVTIRLSSARV